MVPSDSRCGILAVLLCLASVTEVSAQRATQGWVLGLSSGAATVSFEGDPGDGAALVGLLVGYGLNSIVTPYLSGEYADIRSRGLEVFDRVTFSHVDFGVRLHLTDVRRRWVPYGDLALTFWQVSDVVKNGKPAAVRFTSMPAFGVGGGLAIHLAESWALDVNIKAATSTFRNVPVDAASTRLSVGVLWLP